MKSIFMFANYSRNLLSVVATVISLGGSSAFAMAGSESAGKSPNIILIVCDNLGYGDVGCFGSKKHRTPNIDRMAREGRRFTSFYVTSGVCTPSRASIMTGCYPRRANMHVDEHGGLVLRPVSSKGLHPDEITVAEILRQQGYATALIGKWHLGDQVPFLPTHQGFDYYFGIPYSDDMTQRQGKPWPPLPLLRNEAVIEAPVDRNQLTRRYTEETIRFIKQNRRKPFFVFLSHAMPGSTRQPFAGKRFRGKSANGPYGDSVEEIDWSTGQILAALNTMNLDKKTLVIWTSDNGAPRRNPPQGSNLPLSGWGYTATEGGMRVPCIMRWPGRIPSGTTEKELCSTLDLLPTFATLAGISPPKDRKIDGYEIEDLMAGEEGAKSPNQAFYYYYGEQLQAVRSGRWKLYLPLDKKKHRGKQAASRPAKLYDLVEDLQEKTNLLKRHPKVVQDLLRLARRARIDIGDLGIAGRNQRPAGFVEKPKALVIKK